MLQHCATQVVLSSFAVNLHPCQSPLLKFRGLHNLPVPSLQGAGTIGARYTVDNEDK